MVGDLARPPMVRRAVVRIPDARWLRWVPGRLEVGDGSGHVQTMAVSPDALTLVGRTFAGLRPRTGERRLAVTARFDAGATVLIDRRGGRFAVAASPAPRAQRARIPQSAERK